MKSSPKPARIAPPDRNRPRATNHRRAPTPTRGIAAEAILRRKPKIATSHGVEVVPRVAPMLIAMACENVTRPALTKPITVRIVAVEDWIATVKSAPDTTALNRPDTSVCSARRSESPARLFSPSVRWWIPSRNRPRPPSTFTKAAASMGGSSTLPRRFARESGSCRHQLLPPRRVDCGKFEVEHLDRLHDRGGDDEPGEPLVVGRHDEPRRVPRRRGPDRRLVGLHVIVPVLTLADVSRREFPVLIRTVEACHEAFLLLVAREVQKELQNDGPLPREVVLEVSDVGEPLVPDALAHEAGGEPLLFQNVLVHAHDE